MNATIAATLRMASRYSTSPNRLTLIVLMRMSAADAATTHSHCGADGNQNVT